MTWNLLDLKKSSQARVIGGVCGGLGEYTPVPAWMWRALFLLGFLMAGIGLIPYIVLWICMPSAQTSRSFIEGER